jgi:hypothetical protein
VYNFGIVLYEMVAGRLPFDGNSVIEVFNTRRQTGAASKPGLTSRTEAHIEEVPAVRPS